MEEQKQDKKEAIADAAQKISDNKEVRYGAPTILLHFTAKRCHFCRKGLHLVLKSDGQRSDCPEVIANVEVQVSEDSELGDPKSAGDDVHCFHIAFT